MYGAESDGLIAAESLPDLMLGQSETQPIILLYFSFCKGVNGLVVVSPSGRSAYRVSCSNGSYSPPSRNISSELEGRADLYSRAEVVTAAWAGTARYRGWGADARFDVILSFAPVVSHINSAGIIFDLIIDRGGIHLL